MYLQHPENHLSPLLARGLLLLDPEVAHRLAIVLCRVPYFLPHVPTSLSHDPLLSVSSLAWPNPIGLAAGFDKNAEAIDGLSVLGFGCLEIGSVTPLPQDGQARPRVFRLPASEAVINRYGFNSEGHASVLYRLLRQPVGTVGVNVGKNKTGDLVDDVLLGIQTFHALAKYLVLNVSSPNTPGLRAVLQDHAHLEHLLRKATHLNRALNGPPLYIKLCTDGFDTDALKALANVLRKVPVDGIILGNTTVQRPEGLQGDPSTIHQAGGLSGPPLKPIHLRAIRVLAGELPETPIIGCGGISSAQDVLEYVEAGAHAVQLYTGLIYRGPQLVQRILRDLSGYLHEQNLTWDQLVAKHRKSPAATVATLVQEAP